MTTKYKHKPSKPLHTGPLPHIKDYVLQKRFVRNCVCAGNGDESWRWQGTFTKSMEPRFRYENEWWPAHWISYAMWKGPVPAGFKVERQRPDGKVPYQYDLNPDHLVLVPI